MLSRSDYRSLDAVAMSQLVREKVIKPSELLGAALREVESANPKLNAVVSCDDSLAFDSAEAVSTEQCLAGVPFPAKDINVHVKGLKLKHACRFFHDVPVSDGDSLLAQRWREAGLVVFGRTNTPEFATDFGCEPEYYGPANNPWNLKLSTGGSSGGAAAAVASGMVPAAHASDSGGSIRVPAACCGLFGFKPTSGLVATGSVYGPLVGGLNCDHAISWSVRDSAALLDATAGPENGTPLAYRDAKNGFLKAIDNPPEKLRIALVLQSPTGMEPDPEIRSCIEAAALLLEELGHTVVSWNWPAESDACDAATVFWANELSAIIDEYSQSIGRSPRAEDLGPVVRWAMEQAVKKNSVDVVRARKQLVRLQRSMAAAMSETDVILSPVVAKFPPETGVLSKAAEESVEGWMETAWQFAPYPEIYNATGQPAMSVPLYQSKGGLPIGVQLAGKVGNDLQLLQLARQLELALPWKDRRPADFDV